MADQTAGPPTADELRVMFWRAVLSELEPAMGVPEGTVKGLAPEQVVRAGEATTQALLTPLAEVIGRAAYAGVRAYREAEAEGRYPLEVTG